MWKDHKQLNRISESIAGWHIGKYTKTPYYIRYNPAVDVTNSIEYTLVAPHEQTYPKHLFQTTVGKIEMFDDGEFGGYLAIGGKKVCNGNFSQIFEYDGEKYVIDSLRHMCSGTFRLIRVNDNGTIEVIYDSDKYRKFRTELLLKMKLENRKDDAPTVAEREQYELNMISQVGLDGYYIGNDLEGNEAVYFLCSGELIDLDKSGRERYQSIKYLLIFDKYNENAPLVIIDLPPEKIDFCDVTSIWSDGLMLAIGCDKEVVMAYLPTMDVEYWTELDDEAVSCILEKKHKYDI